MRPNSTNPSAPMRRASRSALLRVASLCLLGFGLLGTSTSALSQAASSGDKFSACAIPAAVRDSPPIQDGAPLDVKVGIVLIDVTDVNDVDQTFQADAVIDLIWRDPRLSAKARSGSLADCHLTLKDIWNPDLRPSNLRTVIRTFGESLKIADDGTVRFNKQMLAIFSARFLLHDFPFDIQTLRIRLASFSYGPEVLRFIPRNFSKDFDHDFSIAGWTVINDRSDAAVKSLRVEFEQFARLDHVILIARESGYYLWNFVLPLTLIVLMAWTVFWLDPQSWGSQIGIATASAFTLVAFLITLRSQLPPVPYLTRLDELIMYSTVLVFIALAQVIVTSRLAQTDRLELARRFDAAGRWIYLGTYVVVFYLTLYR